MLPRVRAVEAEAGKLQLELVQDGEMVETDALEEREDGQLRDPAAADCCRHLVLPSSRPLLLLL